MRRIPGLVLVALLGLMSLVGSGGGGGGDGGTPTPLTVSSTNPASGATSVAISTAISATFNLALTASPTFAVSGPGGAVAGSVGISGQSATFTPSAALANAATYTVSVSGGTGAGGGTLASAVSWSFTTVAAANTPQISLSSASLTFNATQSGANPASQSVNITNSGTGALSGLSVGTVTYGTGATGWIQSANLGGTTAPTSVVVQPATAGLVPGSYTATVPILSGVASNSPQAITVTFNITSGSSGVTINGLADYASVPPNTTTGALNYAGTTFKPIRGATVEIIASPGGATLASGITSSSGNYSLNIATSQAFFVRVKAEMKRVAASGGQWNFTVLDNTSANALYVLDSAPVTPSTSTVTQNMRANSGWGGSSYTSTRAAAPFSILDVVYNATQKVLTASPDANFPPLKLFWSVNNVPVGGNLATGQIGTSFYTFNNNEHQTYILGAANTDTDEYDTHVIAHEWGHFFQAAFSRSDSIGGSHSGGQRLDMRLAFGEGWGNAWSGMAMGTPIYTDSSGNAQAAGFTIDLTVPATTNPGWFSEQSVGYLLYNFHQNANIGFTPLFNVMTGSLRTDGALAGMHAFAQYLKAALPAQAAAITSLLAAQSIVAQDALGTGETNSGGIALALPVHKTHTAALGATQNYCVTDAAGTTGDESNKLGAYVYVRFTLAASGSRTITVTSTSAPATADPDFLVQQANGTKSAFELTGTSEVGTLTLPAGTHTLIATDYNLTHSASTGTSCFNVLIQ